MVIVFINILSMTNSTVTTTTNNNNKKSGYRDSYDAVAETSGLKIGTPGITIDTAIFSLILFKAIACLSFRVFFSNIIWSNIIY